MKPILVFAIGNPSRGDDALGSLLLERLEDIGLEDVELLTDFQLQIEHVLDLRDRLQIIFVDAAASGPSPFSFEQIQAIPDNSLSSHAVSPRALLQAYRQHFGEPPPPAWLLAIRGHSFALGEGLSDPARANLENAKAFLIKRLRD